MRKGFVYGNRRLIDLFKNRPGLKERVDAINKASESEKDADESTERNNTSQNDNR